MKILWDEYKNLLNQEKYRISFELAQRVFDDPLHLSRYDRVENGELRWQTIGLVGNVALLLVAHSVIEAGGEDMIRIISARKADKRERKVYEQSK